MLTISEAEPILGLKRARIMQLKAEGKLHLEKRLAEIGGSKLYISQAEIDRFLRERAEERDAMKGPGRRPRAPRTLS